MQRRKYLELLGVGAGATVHEVLNLGSVMPQSGPEDEPPGPFEDACTADARINDFELVVDGSDAFAAVNVENGGETPTGELGIAAEFLDADGAHLDDGEERIGWLGPDERWDARIRSFEEPTAIEELRVAGVAATGYPAISPDLEVIESEFEQDAISPAITGVVENTAERDFDRAEVFARVRNEDGSVLADGRDYQRDIAAGQDWNFEVSLFDLNRPFEVAEHDVIVDVGSNVMPMAQSPDGNEGDR